jgi:hypothetical protein
MASLFDRQSTNSNSIEGLIMSHVSHLANPSFLIYQLQVPQANKKPAPKTTGAGRSIEGRSIAAANRDRISDDDESGDDGSDGSGSGGNGSGGNGSGGNGSGGDGSGGDGSAGRRGFDFTV